MVYHVQRGHVVHDHFLGSCKASNCSRYTWHHCKLACFVASEKLRMSLQAISSLKSQNTSLMDSPLLGSCQTRNENEGFDQWKKKVELCLKVAFEKWMNMGYMQELDEVKTPTSGVLVMKHHIQQIASLANKRWLPGKPPPCFKQLVLFRGSSCQDLL